MGPVEQRLSEAKGYVDKGWTQFHTARDEHGTPVSPEYSGACRWCAVGALAVAKHKSVNADSRVAVFAAHLLAEAAGKKRLMASHAWTDVIQAITSTNDNQMNTQAEASEWFDGAIKLAHERGL